VLRSLALLMLVVTLSCHRSNPTMNSARRNPEQHNSEQPIPPKAVANSEQAIFAGGCFWCMEPAFEKIEGVSSVESGYAGGHVENPTYEQVCSGSTGHAEVIRVTFDPKVVSYTALLDIFWRNIDPTVKNRQFCDVGSQYRSAIFTTHAEHYKIATASKQQLVDSGRLSGDIHTEITQNQTFYLAEAYHQNYYKTHPIRYKQYRYGCGRDKRLQQLWGDSH